MNNQWPVTFFCSLFSNWSWRAESTPALCFRTLMRITNLQRVQTSIELAPFVSHQRHSAAGANQPEC